MLGTKKGYLGAQVTRGLLLAASLSMLNHVAVATEVSNADGTVADETETTEPSALESDILERSQARWSRLVAGDVEGAYEFTSPAYRSKTPLSRFRARFGGAVQWMSASPRTAECQEHRCRVTVEVSYQLPKEGFEHMRPITETWIRASGEWWISMQ